MFGKNPQRRIDTGPGDKLWIQEIFYTIQGEGPLTGTPSIFVRLAGCNLKCYFCDTDFESSTWEPGLQEIIDVIDEKNAGRTDLIVITGGEPFRQNIIPLCRILNEADYRLQVETDGLLYQTGIPDVWDAHADHPFNEIVCSPKTPNLNPKLIPYITAYKYIIQAGRYSEEDGLPLGSTQDLDKNAIIYRPPDALRRDVYVQPCDEQDEKKNAANLFAAKEIAMHFGYRLSLQTHKILELP